MIQINQSIRSRWTLFVMVILGTLVLGMSELAGANSQRKDESKWEWGPKADLNSDACRLTEADLQVVNCVRQPLSKNQQFEAIFDDWVLEAANAYSVHPAILKAIAHVESTFDPLASSGFSDGLCALGENTCKLELETRLKKTPRPQGQDRYLRVCSPAYNTNETQVVITKRDGTTQACRELPVWSPRGQFLAAAELLYRNSRMKLRVKDKKDRRMSIQEEFFKDPASLRALQFQFSQYNKGMMAHQAVQAYYESEGKLPVDYASAWQKLEDERFRQRGATLYTQENFHIGKCYLWKVIGLCGRDPKSYFSVYEKGFVKNQRTGKWERKKD